MWGREEEIAVGQQICWHGDCAVQVILDSCRAPAWLWLPAFTEGKAEARCTVGSGELEFPRQLSEPRPPSVATKPGPWALRNCSLYLHQLETWLWAVPTPSSVQCCEV